MERDEETLAWIISNLVQTSALMSIYRKEEPAKPEINANLPERKEDRRRLFDELDEVCHYIGNKNHTFTGNPFAFNSVIYQNDRVLRCMFAVAGYDLNLEMIDRLAAHLPKMDVHLRQCFYMNLLSPERNAKHRAYLRAGLQDKSIHVKELVVKKLAACKLGEEDIEALAMSLRSKSSGLRKAVLSVLKEQREETLFPIMKKMVTSQEEYQIQASIELLLERKLEGLEAELEQLKERKLSTQTIILLEQLTKEDSKQEIAYTEENGFGLYDPAKIAAEASKEEVQSVKAEKKGFLQKLFGKKEMEEPVAWDAKRIRLLYPAVSDFDRMLERM